MVDEQGVAAVLKALSVIMPAFYLTLISTRLSSAYVHKQFHLKLFLLEFTIIIVPIVLIATILEARLIAINLALMKISLSVYAVTRRRMNKVKYTLVISEENDEKINCITNARSTINMLTAIAILAARFNVFPAHFHKTSSYGFSLMDVGGGLFIYANGIVAPEIKGKKCTIYLTIVNVIPLLVIGIGRFVVLDLIDYYVEVTEYGVHWNFFITLAVTKLISTLIMAAINSNMIKCLIIGVTILFCHQLILYLGAEQFVFSDIARDNFFNANREGIVSSAGYIGLYLISVAIGFVLQSKSKIQMCILTVTTPLFCGLGYILYLYFDISRCVANSTYCCLIIFIGLLMTNLFYMLEKYLNYAFPNSNNQIFVPFIFESINFNGLVFFLLANIFAGLIHMSVYANISNINSLLIIIAYALALSILVCFLYIKKIRLKLC